MKLTFSYKHIWTIAYPIIIANIAQNIVNITDTAFLGRVGVLELAASAIAGVFYFVFFMMGFGFATGTQIIIAKKFGENKESETGLYFTNTIYFLLLLSIALILSIIFIAPYFLNKGIESYEIFIRCKEYLDYRAYGLIFSFINVTIGAFFIGMGKTKIISWSFIFLAIINIVLDYILIFGKFGFSPMGIKGAAIASVIAEFSATIFLIFYMFKFVDIKRYQLFKFVKPSKAIIVDLFNISTPVMLQLIISIGAWFTFFMLVEKMGETSLAVSNIVRSIYIVLMIPIWGFAASVNTLTSNLIGQGKYNEVFPLILKAILACGFFELILAFFTAVFPELWIYIYTNEAYLITETKSVLYVISSVLLLLSTAFILFNGVLGTSKTLIALIVETITIFFYLSTVYVLVYIFDSALELVWASEFIYAIILGLGSYLYLKYGKWKPKTSIS